MYVDLSKLPDPPKKYQVFLNALYGGLNLSRSSSDIADNQLSDGKNVLFEDGAIKNRPGQRSAAVAEDSSWTMPAGFTPIAMLDRSWNDHLFFSAISDSETEGYCKRSIFCYDIELGKYTELDTSLRSEQGNQAGCFFLFGEDLFYKEEGGYLRIYKTVVTDSGFNIRQIGEEPFEAYIPVTHINVNPLSGVGDLYQPRNVFSSSREVWFNAIQGFETVEIACDGETKTFHLPYKQSVQRQEGDLLSVSRVYIGAALGVQGTDYSVDLAEGTVTTLAEQAPAVGLKLTVTVRRKRFSYRLPTKAKVVGGEPYMTVFVKNLAYGDYVEYSFAASDPQTHQYTYSDGVIEFGADDITGGAWVDDNVLNSFVKVKYWDEKYEFLPNPVALACTVAMPFGFTGIETNCVVFAGCTRQKNAYFWSGSGTNGPDPTYFPETNYNFAGEYDDEITGLGRQQDKLVIFNKNRVGAATFGTTEVDGRTEISMTYRSINDKIGCDAPNTIQLVNNNLVWFNSRRGVMYLKDSTYAYENVIVCISDNIWRHLQAACYTAVRQPQTRRAAWTASYDDGKRYWLIVGGEAYVWDYSLQGYTSDTQKLSWWEMDGIVGRCYAQHNGKIYGVSAKDLLATEDNQAIQQSSVVFTQMTTASDTQDFGKPFDCYFVTKNMNFGTFAYRKNVDKLIVWLPVGTEPKVKLTYLTDLEQRDDLTDADAFGDSQDPGRNASVKVRKPKCLHINEFALKVSALNGRALEVSGIQIFYTFVGYSKAGRRM